MQLNPPSAIGACIISSQFMVIVTVWMHKEDTVRNNRQLKNPPEGHTGRPGGV